MLTLKKRRIIFVICGLLFVAAAPLLLLYTLGYRVDRNFKIGRIGGIYISSPVSGSEIFVDGKLEKQTNILQSGMFLEDLKTGPYSVIVAKDGYWTWQKTLEIREGMVTEARAFLMPMDTKGARLFKGNFTSVWASPYQKILLLEENRASQNHAVFYLPDTDTFLSAASNRTSELLAFKSGISKIFWEQNSVVLEDGGKTIRATFNTDDNSVTASLENNYVFAANNKYERATARKEEQLWQNSETNEIWYEWLGDAASTPYYLCDTKPCASSKYLVSSFRYPIKNADFFPGRRDIIIAAVQNSVFAIEVDGRNGRLTQPIYKGKNPTFALFQNATEIYVLDDGILYSVNLK